ncbi:dynamin family protein [Aliterella atlantica]|uniref:Dynamin n=1 Tax=Aliterella atlantica CENA595 TaxID=1618023 RepID=A0A0D8ZPL9_9CYAN|nr:dynamin family protein [Aliterella atlantica]KJH70454.1 dynamin [Aliterella atlantica CENA595]
MKRDVNAELVQALKAAIGLLEKEQYAQLRKDVISICDYVANPIYQIAVFAPFNYGKSTLLNAMLGSRTLPIDLIPTTGAAIRVGYGDELKTCITLTDGTHINSRGTDILQQYALLDEQRCMRSDVASVDVFYPHPFLQTGVEFLDLPGTNDRQAQDELVRDRLLTIDLVVQVLDARKLMTLGERENLRDWLEGRGITTVVFVVNFLNLLEADEQKEVLHRLRFVAESFRSELPPGISNLYRVDALPALRARLKGDVAAAQTSGLATFESALQNIAAVQKEEKDNRLQRVQKVASQVKVALETKKQAIAQEVAAAQAKHQAKIEIKQKAETLIKQGFQASSSTFQSWLYLPKLLERYQLEIILALQQGSFSSWQEQFKLAVLEYQKAINQWIDKACDFFNTNHPGTLSIAFPAAPQISLPPPPTNTTKSSNNDITPVAIATGFGWLLGGPVGAAVVGGVSYILNQNNELEQPEVTVDYQQQITRIYTEVAKDYLTRFSEDAFATLYQYEQTALLVIGCQKNAEKLEVNEQSYQIQLIENLLENLS